MFRDVIETIKAFPADRNGNVAMMFGLCFIGFIGMAGLAVDYSRQQNANAKMQSAVDNVALSLALDARTQSSAVIQSRAESLFNAAIASEGYQTATITASFVNGAVPRLDIQAQGNLASSFGRIFGYNVLPLQASARVPIKATKLEIVLVLDNTGSMNNNNKLTELKAASKSLITTIKNAATASGNQARISIVPFAVSVNIGTGVAAASWLDWAEFGGNPSNWNGCVKDRSPPFDINNTVPNGDAFTWYPTTNCSVTEIMPLSNNWTALEQKIDAMSAGGNTNVTIGAAWGFNMLTHGAPLSTAEAAAPGIAKYMIILTDGMNTQNRWTSNASQIDPRTSQACDSIKAAGIQIYSVRVINGNPNLISSCASSPSMYYNINSASELSGVFNAIAKQMSASIYLGG